MPHTLDAPTLHPHSRTTVAEQVISLMRLEVKAERNYVAGVAPNPMRLEALDLLDTALALLGEGKAQEAWDVLLGLPKSPNPV
jgi:hypothetical protein